MDLSIIIVSYNTKKVFQDCLQSIKNSQDKLKKEVIVVDNNSSDDSPTMVRKKFPDYKFIVNKSNLGFAKANNIAVQQAKGKYVWLLNSDTILKPDTIDKLLNLAKQHQSHIASCQLLNQDNTIQPQGGFLPKLFTNLAAWMFFIDDIPLIKYFLKPYQQRSLSFFKKDQHPGWLAGTALLIKRSLYQQLKGLDENIFMYGEDVEFCLRASQQNIKPDYFHQPKLVHLGQASPGSQAIIGEYQGLKYIFKKHKPKYQYPLLRLLLKIGALLRIIIFAIILRDKQKKQTYEKAFKLA